MRSDSTSLSESIYSYVYENGRTYHAYRSGSYVRTVISIRVQLEFQPANEWNRFCPMTRENRVWFPRSFSNCETIKANASIRQTRCAASRFPTCPKWRVVPNGARAPAKDTWYRHRNRNMGHRRLVIAVGFTSNNLDWLSIVADQFPGAEVIGVDLSPIQPGWYV